MKIIKIDRSTIKKNSNAGSTRSYLQGPYHATFAIESDDIPAWLLKAPFYPTEWSEREMRGEISGKITEEMIEKFKTVKGLTVNIHREPIVIDHFPEADYFYEYKETKLKCKFCKNKIDVDDIEEDWLDDIPVMVCPVCRHINTFPDYKYEKIGDVIK